MTRSWILVANASEARLFSAIRASLINGNQQSLELIREYDHPSSRKKALEIVSDKCGSYRSGDSGHGHFVEPSDPRDYEADTFARELAGDLELGFEAHEYDDLMVIAPPNFHGKLNKHLKGKIRSVVSIDIEKDYTKQAQNELYESLEGYL